MQSEGPTDQRAARHGNKRPLVLTTKPLSDIIGQRSSLLLIPIPLPPSLHTVFYPPRHFLRHPLLSILWSRYFCLRCGVFRCLLLNMHLVPYSQHQDACYTLCCIILLFWGRGLLVKRGEQGRAAAWRDHRAIFPMAPLDTDFRLHASPWNITPLHPPLWLHHTQLEVHPQPS